MKLYVGTLKHFTDKEIFEYIQANYGRDCGDYDLFYFSLNKLEVDQWLDYRVRHFIVMEYYDYPTSSYAKSPASELEIREFDLNRVLTSV